MSDEFRWPDGNMEACCGYRQAGGIYWEVGFGGGGAPPSAFVICPPLPIPDGVRVAAQGVTPIVVDGVTHLLAHIGNEYASPADFYQEYKVRGLSWRIPETAPFAQLDPVRSCLLLAHDRGAVFTDGGYQDIFPFGAPCIRYPDHQHKPDFAGPCCGAWKQTLPKDKHNDLSGPPGAFVSRMLPSALYTGRLAPATHVHYEEAICFSFGLGRFAVVEGAKAAAHAAKLWAAGLTPAAVVK